MSEASGASMPGSDAELLNTIRSGDSAPFDLLRARHAAAARYLAAQLLSEPAAAGDTVELAFSRVLDAIRRGGGPTDAFRPYLLTAVRRAAAGSAPVPVDDQQLPDPGQLLAGPAATGPDGSLVLQAFLSLPERWRAALWHTDIELATPAEAAPLLGLTAAGVLDLARRARDGLARAYLQLRQRAGEPDPAALADPNAALREAVAPAVLGEAAAAYLAGLTEAGVAGAGIAAATRPARPGKAARPARSSRSGAAAAGAAAAATAGRNARPGPQAASGDAAGGWLRHTSGQQRAIAAGVAAVLAMFAVGGYVLSTSSGARTPAASTQTADTATSASPAPARSTSAAPRPSHTAAGPGRTPPGTPGKLPPTSATPIAAPPPPGPPASGPPASGPPPTHRRPGRPHGPRRPHAQVTTQVSVFGPWGHSSVAAVAFAIADIGPAATAPLSAYVSLPPDATLVTGGHWGGDRSGWNCSARPGGVSCAHPPISAAGRTGGLITVQVTGSRACGQPVQVSVTGGASTASAQSAGTIQCSRWHRGWSQHAAERQGVAQQTAARQPATGSRWPGQQWHRQQWHRQQWHGQRFHVQHWRGHGSGRRGDGHGSRRHGWRWSGR